LVLFSVDTIEKNENQSPANITRLYILSIEKV
jgi:hypothetical protein